MVEQRPVNVGWQTIFMILPYIWIFAFYRIQKLRMGLVLLLITVGVTTAFQMILPFPYGLGSALVISIGIPIYFIRKWSREWNKKFQTENS